MLDQYIDAKALIRDLEAEIEELEKRQDQVMQDTVRGSNHDFPYEERHFKIEGVWYSQKTAELLSHRKYLLKRNKEQAEALTAEVQKWMGSLPPRIQRIIKYHFFEGMTWGETAKRLGRRATGDSVRMEFNNYFD